MKIALTEFAAKRHWGNTPYTKCLMNSKALCAAIGAAEEKTPGTISGDIVKFTSISPDLFQGTLVRVTPETRLRAELVTRRAGEEAYVQVTSPDDPTALLGVTIILYSKATLAEEEIIIDGEYGIVSINGQIDPDEPQAPTSLARNVLGKVGGTIPKTALSAEDVASSIWYWKDVVLHKPE